MTTAQAKVYVEVALRRKEEIDNKNAATLNMSDYTRWIVDAVEVLLRVELERMNGGKA